MSSFRSCLLCAGLSSFFLWTAQAESPPADSRFKIETLLEGMPQPMQLEIAPDGRIFLIEIAGKLKIFKPDERRALEAGTLEVTTEQENGLLGMALDPDFARNGWIYLLRSPKTAVFSGQVLSRFTMQGDQLDPGSEKEMLRYAEQRRECCHHAGGLRFGPDGCLYISSGDNTNPFNSDGYSPHDELPGRDPWDAQKSAANTNDLRGKILRIKPTPDGHYTIPGGNLFPPESGGGRPEIYVMGCRNPWRFNIDPATNILYFGDVGPDAGVDDPKRGPRGHDEVNQVRRAGFFGWPYFNADNKAYVRYDFAAKKTGEPFNPQRPENHSPNNTGAQQLPPAQPAWIFYPGNDSTEFPMLGKGGRTACAGPVFHFQPQFEKTGGFPAQFDNCLVIYDWSRPFIKWVRLDQQSNRVAIEPFISALTVKRPVDMVFGPDGCFYLLEYGETWGPNRDAKLLKVSYQYGNLEPVAAAMADKTAGREPFTVELQGGGSKDPDGTIVRYEWRLQPGDRVIGTEQNVKTSIASPGNYEAELRVTDNQGASSSARVVLLVGNAAPQASFEAPQNGDFFTPGKPITYRISVTDFEDGSSAQNPDEFGARTVVTARWSRTGKKEEAEDPGLVLMKQSDCFYCHNVEQKLIGPGLVEIAERYRGQTAAIEPAIQRVINGSTGVWGELGMLPHPQHSADEVAHMVQWVLGLKPGQTGPLMARGISGEISVPVDADISGCTLVASYTDAGRDPAPPLVGSAEVRLRAPRIEADQNDGQEGPTKLSSGGCTGAYCLGAIDHGHHVRFAAINLAGITSVTFRASSGNVGGRIELRADSVTGSLLGAVDVPNTGGWDKWVEWKTPIKPTARGAAPEKGQRSDLYVIFSNPGKGGLMNLDWLQFNHE